MKKRKNTWTSFAAACLVSLIPLATTSCSIFKRGEHPLIVEIEPQKEASFDGEDQNAGVISYIDGKGFLITAGAAKRYTELTKIYGENMTPKIGVGEGLSYTSEGIYLPSEYMAEFVVMSDKYRRNVKQ